MSETMLCLAQKSSIFLGLADAADQRAGQGAALHHQVEHGRRRVRLLGHADQHHGAVTLECVEERVQVVRRGHGVEDEIQGVVLRRHLRFVFGNHHFAGAQAQCISTLAFGSGEQHHGRAHRLGDLHRHVAQAAEADYAHLLARTHPSSVPAANRW